MTQIRAMTEEDVPAVSRLMEDSWRRTYGPILGEDAAARISGDRHAPDRLASDLADTDMMSFVAERSDGVVVGYVMAQFKDGDVMLDRLHVDSSEFGTGVAVDLLHAVLAAHAGMPSNRDRGAGGQRSGARLLQEARLRGRRAKGCTAWRGRPCVRHHAQAAVACLGTGRPSPYRSSGFQRPATLSKRVRFFAHRSST